MLTIHLLRGETPMMVRFDMVFRTDRRLRQLLWANGWDLHEPQAGTLYASHPQARDQPAARSLLNDLGLLTSGRLRIQFGPFRGAGGAPSTTSPSGGRCGD
jgi:hypothetical protein